MSLIYTEFLYSAWAPDGEHEAASQQKSCLMVHQMDVKDAYLYAASIDCDLSAKQSLGFAINGKSNEKLLCKPERSSYILKPNGRN